MSVKGRYPVPAKYGDRVEWKVNSSITRPPDAGVGTFVLCWLGIEEVWDVKLDDGKTTVHLYPCFGDTMTPIDPNAPTTRDKVKARYDL